MFTAVNERKTFKTWLLGAANREEVNITASVYAVNPKNNWAKLGFANRHKREIVVWERNARLLSADNKKRLAAAGREIGAKGKEWQRGGRSVLSSSEKEKLGFSEKYCMYQLIFSF